MISRIARLRAKKGFTIVELFVVVAIITVLLAMVIPLVYYDTKPAVAKTMAKDFYYKVQEVLTDCKAINLPIPQDFTCYYAKLDENSEVTETGRFYMDGGYTIKDEITFGDGSTDKICSKMREMMLNYLTSELTKDMSGYLVAACDKKHRVVGTYWFEEMYDAGISFDNENILVTGKFCCAFPLALSAPGAKTFRFSDINITET